MLWPWAHLGPQEVAELPVMAWMPGLMTASSWDAWRADPVTPVSGQHRAQPRGSGHPQNSYCTLGDLLRWSKDDSLAPPL